MSNENNGYGWDGNQSDNNSANGSSYSSENSGQDYAFESVLKSNGKPKSKGCSVAAMVLGIVSVVACCSGWASLFLGIGAIVFAIVARKTLGYFDGMAIAGLILGIFGVVFGLFMIIFSYFFVEMADELFPDGFFDDLYDANNPGLNWGEF